MMMDQILDLHSERELLQLRIKQRDDKIRQWLTEGPKTILEDQTNKYAEAVRKGSDEVRMLNSTIANKHQQAVERNKSLEEQSKKLENLRAELMKLNSHSDELRIWQKHAESDRHTLSKETDNLKCSIQNQSKTREKLEYLNKACGSFESVLGLSFKKTKGNRMQVIFTNLDEKDPSMQFYFFLQIQNSSRKYVMTDPEPAVTGLPELVEKLNSTNNIRAFMIEMRHKFKETLKS